MKQQSITNLPLSPDEERRRRMIKYSVAMGIRVLCIIAILFVPGWWAVIPAIGAVFLPYFAVVIANVGADPRGADVQRPGNILPMTPPSPAGAGTGAAAGGGSDDAEEGGSAEADGGDAARADGEAAAGDTDATGGPDSTGADSGSDGRFGSEGDGEQREQTA